MSKIRLYRRQPSVPGQSEGILRKDMQITQVVTNKPDYLHFIDDGEIHDKEDFLEFCMEAITKALQHGQKRILLDNRTLSIDLSRQDVREVANQLVEMNAQDLGLRLAVISSRDSSGIARFVETSFIERSATYRRFDSQREALVWLLA